jgi:hypothetical protein
VIVFVWSTSQARSWASVSGPVAFEVKRKRQPKVIFNVEPWRIGEGYYVRATLPDGTKDRIEGFAKEDEAGRWIKDESLVWLYNRSSKGEVAN